MIEELSKPGTYEKMEKLGAMLEDGFHALAKKFGIKIYARHMASIFILFFGFEEDTDDFRDWLTKADIPFYREFSKRMEQYGVRLTDKRGREYLSVQHTEEDIRKTLEIAEVVLSELVS